MKRIGISQEAVSAEGLRKLGPSFNPEYLSPERLAQIIDNLSEAPVFDSRTPEEHKHPPKDNDGLAIDLHSRQIFWVIPGKRDCYTLDGKGSFTYSGAMSKMRGMPSGPLDDDPL